MSSYGKFIAASSDLGYPSDGGEGYSGAVHVFQKRAGSNFEYEGELNIKSPRNGTYNLLGMSIDLCENDLIVGAPRENSETYNTRNTGAAYIYGLGPN